MKACVQCGLCVHPQGERHVCGTLQLKGISISNWKNFFEKVGRPSKYAQGTFADPTC